RWPSALRVLPVEWLRAQTLRTPHAALLTLARVLEVHDVRFTGERLAAVLGRQELAGLTELDLETCRVGERGARAILEATHLEHLERLDLDSTHLRNDALLMLTRCEHLSGVREVDLSYSHFSRPEDALSLARAPWLAGVCVLRLRHCSIPEPALEALLDAPQMLGVTHLDLAGTPFSTRLARKLASAPWLADLVHLDLSFTAIGSAGEDALRRSSFVTEPVLLGMDDWVSA
ncbi:MAG: hypothetical protein AAGI01_17895, partial [Myxococcota bacterium]